ncbi:MAG: biotin--[acetyl-CoA-carboxylase] ligase [Desulfopila sp.]
MRIFSFSSIDSTNRKALELAEQGADHGTAVVAESQSRGRGRLGRSWQSVPGKGLYCSIILYPNLPLVDFPRLTFAAGLAVAEAIDRLYHLNTGLKWPNDIYFGRKKCGGILTESANLQASSPSRRSVVVGIGLNVNTAENDFSEELRMRATSLLLQSGREIALDELFSCIHSGLLAEVDRFERQGFQQLMGRWRTRDILKGQRMRWLSTEGCCVEGISLGPDDSGLLHIVDDAGCRHEVLSGDVQLAASSGQEK